MKNTQDKKDDMSDYPNELFLSEADKAGIQRMIEGLAAMDTRKYIAGLKKASNEYEEACREHRKSEMIPQELRDRLPVTPQSNRLR